MGKEIIAFTIFTVGICYYGMTSNDPSWNSDPNRCTGECYAAYVEEHGTPVEREIKKKELRAAASPAQLGKEYYAQCIGCHGSQGEGGVGPQLAGQSVAKLVEKLTAYRQGETRGNQSSLMWSVAKPMSDTDINNLSEYITTL